MAVSVESPSSLNKAHRISMVSSPALLSPSSEKRFWSALQNRVDSLLQNRRKFSLEDCPRRNLDLSGVGGELESGKGSREDCLLLLRGFDSISSSLSQLTSNIDTALQGAKELAKPSLMFNDPETSECDKEEENKKREKKRKIDLTEPSDGQGEVEKDEEVNFRNGKLKKAKNLAISMATKAASLARELKSIKSDMCFMQERCTMLQEENKRLREGYGKGMRHEEDDLVRLQLEALLAEKSRLAHENANLNRENQCLHQLVEYHQLTSQDLSASYEQVIHGMCLDFDDVSPTPPSGGAGHRLGEDIDPVDFVNIQSYNE